MPIPINQNSTDYKQAGLAPLPASIAIGAAAPEVYRFAGQLPASAILMELPLGEPAFDVRYMFYSTLALAAAGERLQRRRAAGVRGCSPSR